MGKTPKRYTANEAIGHIFGEDGETVISGGFNADGTPFVGYLLRGLPAKAYEDLLSNLERDEANYRIGLCGWWWNNPFNYYPNDVAKFPKNAYVSWWQKKPRGAELPTWLTEGFEWEEDAPMCDEGVAPWDELPPQLPQESVESSPKPDSTPQEIQAEESGVIVLQTSQSRPEVTGTTEIIDGLTVADVRTMCERSKALASVLRTVAKWQAIKKENPDRMTEDALKACLTMAARKDGWGTDKGELAENSQYEPLKKLITGGWRPGGRPPKKANG